jgi:hypothetical protein
LFLIAEEPPTSAPAGHGEIHGLREAKDRARQIVWTDSQLEKAMMETAVPYQFVEAWPTDAHGVAIEVAEQPSVGFATADGTHCRDANDLMSVHHSG